MTSYDDEALMRLIDGELSPEVGARIEAEALRDENLAERLARMRPLRVLARDAFAIAPDARDAALSRMIANVERAPSRWSRMSQSLAETFAPRRVALWGGLAVATFVGGVFVGPLLNATNETSIMSPDGGVADAGLVQILDQGLAADTPDSEGRVVALTYRDVDGRWCRTFRAGEAGVAGLACRDQGRWAIRALAPLGAPTGEIRTAAADTPATILAAVDAALSGETLDADAETRARDGGWR